MPGPPRFLARTAWRRCREACHRCGPRRHPAGRAAAVALAVAVLGAGGSAATSSYTIERGDTLSALAKRVGTTTGELARLNQLANPHRIIAGHTLSLPVAGATAGAPGRGAPRYHVVQRGETLGGIAKRYGVSADAVAAANGLSGSRVMAGARLLLSGRPAPLTGGGGGGPHLVRPGETLSLLAKRYGVSTTALAAANGIADVHRVVAGTTLTVPGGGGWRCPVPGGRFINDYGVAKPDGRFHEGVDLFARRGTPAVAPVSGHVQHRTGSRGGLQYWLRGDDGTIYIGTHLDAFGKSGRVRAGDVIGFVGTSGNAKGTPPHLHFESHPGGLDAGSANPYPLLRARC